MAIDCNYWVWNDVFKLNEIKTLVKNINLNYDKIEPKNLGATNIHGEPIKNLNCTQISYCKISNKLDSVLDRAYSVNTYQFGYNLYPKNKFDSLNFNIYKAEKKSDYGWHCDQSKNDCYDVKLTVLINLSTRSYTGGTFSMFMGNEFNLPEFDKPGTMIMFKSFIHHKISPVIKGERNSLAIFLKGPRFI